MSILTLDISFLGGKKKRPYNKRREYTNTLQPLKELSETSSNKKLSKSNYLSRYISRGDGIAEKHLCLAVGAGTTGSSHEFRVQFDKQKRLSSYRIDPLRVQCYIPTAE